MSPARTSRTGTTGPSRSDPAPPAWLEVRRPGPLATVQDLGRSGFAHLGVPPGGAADAVALRLANALVGNAPGAAGIEATLAGPELVLSHDRVVAVTGAAGGWSVDGVQVPLAAAVAVPAGAVVRVGPAQRGVRSYLAVEGGLSNPLVLGSRSTDTLSRLGPAPLSPGARLPLGPGGGRPSPPGVLVEHGRGVVRVLPPALARLALGERAGDEPWPVVPGPHLGRLGEGAFHSLCATTWAVLPASDRAGLRLVAAGGMSEQVSALGPGRADGAPTERSPAARLALGESSTRSDATARGTRDGRADLGQLSPLGMVTGSVQLPPGGSPIVLLVNHATTGGYPVVGVVVRAALSQAAQARPGSTVRFRAVGVEEARALLRRLEERLGVVGA